MSEEKVLVSEVEKQKADWVGWHLETYLKTGGVEGHLLDLRDVGAHNLQATLLLKTIGQKSGQERITPLMYGMIFGEVVIVGSKGGADVHPAWYFNIQGHDTVDFQIATQAFRASWREPQGEERDLVFEYMVRMFPPFGEYRKVAKREIPLVMMKRIEEIPVFKA